MRGRNLFIFVFTFIIAAAVLFIMVKAGRSKDIWDINAEKLADSFKVISGDAVIEDLSGFIPFEWDALYSFSAYCPRAKIYETIGYKWDRITESVNEGMNQIVFVEDGKVVCYLYGYPEYSGVGFDFGSYEEFYIKLTPDQELSFKTRIADDGIRYFHYLK